MDDSAPDAVVCLGVAPVLFFGGVRVRQVLRVPSGIEITIAGLFRQIASLNADDISFIFKAAHAKPFRQPVGELLGKAFAGQYSQGRRIVTRNSVDFWKIKQGCFRDKFIQAAINARMHSIDLDLLILCAEELNESKKMGVYPSPHLVCGSYVFGEVLNGWTPGSDAPPPPDVCDELPETNSGGGWIWQPGLRWDEQARKFVKNADSD